MVLFLYSLLIYYKILTGELNNPKFFKIIAVKEQALILIFYFVQGPAKNYNIKVKSLILRVFQLKLPSDIFLYYLKFFNFLWLLEFKALIGSE